jgi:hypothetical protein
VEETMILDNIPFTLDEAALLQQLHVRAGRSEAAEALRLAVEAQSLGRPKALYKLVFVEDRGDDWVVIDGVKLTSRVLAVNLEKVHRVFAFVATGGRELEDWQCRQADMLAAFWADQIAELGVRAAMTALQAHLTAVYDLASLSMMNPGSLPDWPLSQQRPLFQIVKDVESTLGVELTSSMLMVPRKSVSGIMFPAVESFASCQLCPRAECPNRRAPYDRELFAKKYAKVEG